LICRPVECEGYVVPGSKIGKCTKCGKSVWLSPSSEELLKEYPDMEIRCSLCENIEEIFSREIIFITPAQMREFKEWESSWRCGG
jgi:DNA-directed RNA polymerase subunit RPC12/RpoP